jgi:hypothetical protein
MMNRLFLAMLTGFVLTAPAYGAADDMNAQTRAKAQQAVDAGLTFLKSRQAPNGSIADSVGLTALDAARDSGKPSRRFRCGQGGHRALRGLHRIQGES